MKKIILSVAVATMALTTAAAALEDIKVNGQAKLWYETWNKGTSDMFDQGSASGESVFTLGVTGKQGNVGFGAKVIQTSTMGLENNLVSSDRTANASLDNNGTNLNVAESGNEMYTSEMYITVPTIANTTLKIGKQEIQTPLAFTEKWNAVPNTFNAALAINKSIDNLTLVAAYIGQSNGAGNFKTNGEVDNSFFDGAQALIAHYKTAPLSVNAYYYNIRATATAAWVDVAGKVGPVNVKAMATKLMPKDSTKDDTTAYGLLAGTKLGSVSLSAAYSTVSDTGHFAAGNTATGFKKTKLPTAGVYTDGLYVAQMGSDAYKIKAVTKFAGAKFIAQAVKNTNSVTASKETTEVDLIIVKKLGDFNIKGIVLDRSFDDAATDKASGGQHVRVIASVNF